MDFLHRVLSHAAETPERVCFTSRGQSLSYGALAQQSARLAGHLLDRLGADRAPIVVFGHKDPLMLVSFLAAVRSGRPYIPVDSSFPVDRVNSVIAESGASLVLAAGEDLPRGVLGNQLQQNELLELIGTEPARRPTPEDAVGPDDPFYIIFTSGSTGRPKGVQISRQSLNRFAAWGLDLVAGTLGSAEQKPAVFLNQAPFSFDLSVMDLAIGLAAGGSLAAVDRGHVARLSELFDMLRAQPVMVWVSTPSFADLCLSDASFGQALLPELREFLFCGETLAVGTAAALRARFPRARVVNTYGPTESTVAVTSLVVDDEVLARYAALPVGRAKPGTRILICDETGAEVADGERGEIVIVGDTVSLGYFGRPDLDALVFGWTDEQPPQRFYRTGDAGYLEDGLVHFLGRLDFQVKLHGYRIEIEDIEANLQRLPGVRRAVVYPVDKPGRPGVYTHLEAVVQADELGADTGLAAMVRLKKQLREFVPDYMVPKLLRFVPEIPMTANGKADRKAARGLVS